VVIDGRTVECEPGTPILAAAARLGIDIPTLCHVDGLPPQSTCFLCLVEVDGRRDLAPACTTAVAPDMVVHTESEKVVTARRTCLELLLSDHAGSCVGNCSDGCPANFEIAAFLDEVEAGDRRAAMTIIHRTLPLPAALGRVCAGFCESACLRKNLDESVSVRSMHGLLAEADLASGDPYVPPCKPDTGRRVAIVGAGPAGLSAAHYLREQGHACVLYDAERRAGGLLRHGPHIDRIPAVVLDGEIGVIWQMGVDLRTGWRLGRDGSLADLCGEYDAVVIAIGATRDWTSDERRVDLELLRSLGLPVGPRGIAADRDTGATKLDRVWAAGEAVLGASNTIRSIASGRRAADAIGAYFDGRSSRRKPWFFRARMSEQETQLRYARDAAPRTDAPSLATALARDIGGLARAEASRCLDCACPSLHDCRLRRFAARYDADPGAFPGGDRRELGPDTSHPEVDYEPGKCILCGLCVAIAEQAGDAPGLALGGRGFTGRVGVPFDDAVRGAIGAAARRCAAVCPSGAITLKRPAAATGGRR